MCVYIHIYANIYIYIYMNIYIWICIYIHIYTFTYIYIYTHTYVYIYIHVHTYTHTRLMTDLGGRHCTGSLRAMLTRPRQRCVTWRVQVWNDLLPCDLTVEMFVITLCVSNLWHHTGSLKAMRTGVRRMCLTRIFEIWIFEIWNDLVPCDMTR